MYRSEIRYSQLEDLINKVRKQNYGKYLLGIQIEKIRGFREKHIRFDFPVTALIGANGSGKSSVLGAAALAYKSMKPDMFFPKSSVGDESMSDWKTNYELIDKKIKSQDFIKRNANFKRSRWNRRNVLERDVLFFGIQRTVAAGEKTIFSKLKNAKYQHNEEIKK